MKKSDILKKIIDEAKLPQADLGIIHSEVSKFLVKKLRREKIFEIPNVGFFTLKTYNNQFIEQGKLVGALFFSETFPAAGGVGETNFGAVKIPAEPADESETYFEMGIGKPVISGDQEKSRETYRELKKTDIAQAVAFKLDRYYNFGQEDWEDSLTPDETPQKPQGLLSQNILRVDTLEDDDDTVRDDTDDGFVFHRTFEDEPGSSSSPKRNFPFSRVTSEFSSGLKPDTPPRNRDGSSPVMDFQDIIRERERHRQEDIAQRVETEERARHAVREDSSGREHGYSVVEETEQKDINEIRKSHVRTPEETTENKKKARKDKRESRMWFIISFILVIIIAAVVYVKIIGIPGMWLPGGEEEIVIKKTVGPAVFIEREYSFPLNYPYPPDKRFVREREGMLGIRKDSLVSYSILLYEVSGGFGP